MSANPVTLAQQLLDLVKSIYEPSSGGPNETLVGSFAEWNTRIRIQNVCDQLLAKVMGPLEYTVLVAECGQESQALHLVTTLGVPDFIGDGEATLAEISAKAAVEPQFLGVAMSCLLGRGFFEEVGRFGSRVYKNNDLSEVLRAKHPKTLKSAVGFIGDEGFRATSRLLDAAKVIPADDGGQKSKRIPATNIAFGFEGSVFAWMSDPERSWRGERLGQAMKQLHTVLNSHVSEDYPWHELHSPIVDVGGGIGSLELSLLKSEHNSHLEFILFDIPGTIENARKFWSNQDLSVAKRVSFVGGNFMAPSLDESNIPTGKPTYMIRHVLHDWADDDVVSILRMVRRAMPSHGRLLLVEMLLHAESSRLVRTSSMQILALNNGMTRTREEMENLLLLAGFKVQRVTNMRAVDSVIESVLE